MKIVLFLISHSIFMNDCFLKKSYDKCIIILNLDYYICVKEMIPCNLIFGGHFVSMATPMLLEKITHITINFIQVIWYIKLAFILHRPLRWWKLGLIWYTIGSLVLCLFVCKLLVASLNPDRIFISINIEMFPR